MDAANYNDFYRVRASVSEGAGFPARTRRYDWPSPHAAGSRATRLRQWLQRRRGDPAGDDLLRLSARATVLELFKAIGAPAAKDAPALPPSTLFTLAAPPADPVHFNALPGVMM